MIIDFSTKSEKIYNPKSQVGLEYVDIEYVDTFKNIRDRNNSKTIEDFDLNKFNNYIQTNKLVPIIIEQGGINLINIKMDFISSLL